MSLAYPFLKSFSVRCFSLWLLIIEKETNNWGRGDYTLANLLLGCILSRIFDKNTCFSSIIYRLARHYIYVHEHAFLFRPIAPGTAVHVPCLDAHQLWTGRPFHFVPSSRRSN